MDIEDFPQCCTARILANFGESHLAEGGGHQVTEDSITESIEHQLLAQANSGMAMLTAITNNEQKVANKVLLKLGFSHSKWMSKLMHGETRVRLWWKPILN